MIVVELDGPKIVRISICQSISNLQIVLNLKDLTKWGFLKKIMP